MKTLKATANRLLLVILDGFGINDQSPQNAIQAAKTPNLDRLFKNYPFRTITGGGEAVGLPKGVVGNSEVGHLNLGAGRPVRQDLVRINEAIQSQTLEHMPAFQALEQQSQRIHILGLLSDGGVHSHIEHIKHILELLTANPKLQIFFHAFMDGRDTPITKGIQYIRQLQAIKGFHFASLQGRSIGMDRDRRWEKIEHAYKSFIGQGEVTEQSPEDYVQAEYDKKIYDEFITPVLFNKDYAIRATDSVFFINFRPDRARQISLAFNDPNFKEFPRQVMPKYFLCMTPYVDEELPELPILFDKEPIKGGLSEYLSRQGHKQFKIAETEKYAHVTYFFNGGARKPFQGEEQILIPSPKEVATYDLKPEMSAEQVTEKLLAALENNDYKFYLVNYANADMVGHTGNYKAAIQAIETLDHCVGLLMQKCLEQQVGMILTADHGNADQMQYTSGEPHTSHTGSPVPLVLFSEESKEQPQLLNSDKEAALKDIAPTVLSWLGLPIPKDFTGKSLLN